MLERRDSSANLFTVIVLFHLTLFQRNHVFILFRVLFIAAP